MAKTEANQPKLDENGLPDFSSFVKEQISFPPYWNPEEGKKIYFVPMQLDDKDKEFQRYVCKALMPIQCAQGPAEDQEMVMVQPGEYFTLSTYTALPLEMYFGFPVLVTTKTKRKIQGGKKELWQFELAVDPTVKKQLESKRVEMAKQMQAESAKTAALAE